MNPVGPMIDPDDLAKTAYLELVSKLMADGLLAGRHRSKMKGGCAEFAEHRAYSPGDEVRLLDWRVFARSDRYVIKQYEEEVSLQAIIAMDASGSMGFGMSTVTKYAYARAASLCLARIVLGQRDSAGLAVMGGGVRDLHPAPRPGQPSGCPEPKPARFLARRPHLHGRGPGGNDPAHQAPGHRPAFLRLF